MILLKRSSLVALLALTLVSLQTPPAIAATGFAVGPKFALAVVNTAPALSKGGIYPTTGNPSTEFLFTVLYTDVDNDRPGGITIQLDSQSPQPMLPVNAGDQNYADGVLYQYRTRLSPGSHTYTFAATDPFGVRGTGEATSRTGPTVTASGTAAELSNGIVSPLTGTAASDFTFAVRYAHPDNLPPSQVVVTLDGQAKTMQAEAGNPDYVRGVLFQYKTKLAVGTHAYAFSAQ